MPGAANRKSPSPNALFRRQPAELLAENVASLDRDEHRDRFALEVSRLAAQHGARFGICFEDRSVNVRHQARNRCIEEQLPVVSRALVHASSLCLERRVLHAQLLFGDLELLERGHEQTGHSLNVRVARPVVIELGRRKEGAGTCHDSVSTARQRRDDVSAARLGIRHFSA